MQDRCKNCKHFVQHYVITKQLKICKTNCGHCTANAGLKLKKECANFERGNSKNFSEQYLCLTDYFNKLNKQTQNLLSELQALCIQFDFYTH